VTSHGLLAQVCAYELSFISGLYSLTRSGVRIPVKVRYFSKNVGTVSEAHTSFYAKSTGEPGGIAPLVLNLDTTTGDYRQSDMVKTG